MNSNIQNMVHQFTHKYLDMMVDLYYRWSDEKDYEDFNDYVKMIKSYVEPEFTVKKCFKRPFGLIFSKETDNIQLKLTKSHDGLKYQYLNVHNGERAK